MRLLERSKEIKSLSASLHVAQERVGHAYQEGMHGFKELEQLLSTKDEEISGLRQEIAKVEQAFALFVVHNLTSQQIQHFKTSAQGIGQGSQRRRSR